MGNKKPGSKAKRAAIHGKRFVDSAGSKWRAVENRDRSADGAFVYAVRSTGIYCKPSCGSRKPKREHVSFFATPGVAETNGFRPCRRCRPRIAHRSDERSQAVARVCREIERRIGSESALPTDGLPEGLTLQALGETVGMGPHQLERAFKSVMNISPREYADSLRMQRLKSRLKKGDDVTTALYDAGFGSSSRLYERAPSHLGMTPATYRRGGQGMNIQYTVVDSPLGRLLVGATERGVSAVYLGERDASLESALRKEYPRAEIAENKNGMKQWVGSILEHLRGHEPNLDLPTDVRATAFQRRVWQELRRIPYGETRSYSDVAKAIGKPKAIRAVARACATNPVSVVVPCHRVVRSDGNPAGYRWGLERKTELLRQEANQTKSKQMRQAARAGTN